MKNRRCAAREEIHREMPERPVPVIWSHPPRRALPWPTFRITSNEPERESANDGEIARTR